MIRISSAVLGAMLVLGSISIASANDVTPQHTYQVRVPKLAASCADEAAALGARFAKATGVTPLSAACTDEVTLKADGQTYSLYTLTVTYEGDNVPLLYSANYGRANSLDRPGEQQGVYSKYSDCLAALDTETATFEAQTGLSAVSALCEPGAYSYETSYVLRIDGFGTPTKTLRGLEVKYLGDSDAMLESKVDGLITGLGGVIVNKVDNQRLIYAPDGFAVKYDLISQHNTEAECNAELAVAQDIYAKLGSKAVVAACLPSYGTHWYLQAVREGYFFLAGDDGSNNTRFYSYDECTRARSRITFENTSYVGGICQADEMADGQYKLVEYSSL